MCADDPCWTGNGIARSGANRQLSSDSTYRRFVPLATRIIGDCPSYGAVNCFGSVMIHGDAVERGCMNCSYGYQ